MSFAPMRSSIIPLSISDRTPDPVEGRTTHNTRSNPLGEWIGMAWRMPIGTAMGSFILILLLAT